MLVCFLMLAACGQTNGNDAVLDESTPIEVELEVPDIADPNEEVTFTSIVTQGDDLVDDATEVVYEIWQEGQKEESQMIEADEQVENKYMLTHVFAEDGLYHVQTHVTARGLHRMPVAQIEVGHVEDLPDNDSEGEEEHHSEHEEHSHSSDVNVETEMKNDRLSIQITLDGEPFTDGEVTLEAWQEGEEKHDWLDTTEIGDGEYELQDSKGLSGTYSVIVHITDEQVHEHEEIEVEF